MKLSGKRLWNHLERQWNKPFHRIWQEKAIRKRQWDKVYISSLYLEVRTFNCLVSAGVKTVEDLMAMSEDRLMGIPNFGKRSLSDVRDALNKISEKHLTRPQDIA
jgi:DNA-directed RNA polymerase subunit alpha